MKIFDLFKPVLCGVIILLPFVSYGQGDVLSTLTRLPLGVMPMQFNSSFAGESEGARFNTAFSYELEGNRSMGSILKSQYFGYFASYDQFVPALRSGIAISVSRANLSYTAPEIQVREGFNGIGASNPGNNPPGHTDELKSYHNNISLAIAPKFSIKGKYTLSPSIDFSYGGGQTTANFIKEKLEIFDPNSNHQWLSSRLGLLFNTHHYYIGYTAYLVNRYYRDNERSPIFYDKFRSFLQAGYTFQRSSASKFSFTPQIAFVITPEERGFNNIFHTRGLNLTFRYDTYIAGINNTGFHLGWQTEKVRVMVSNIPWNNNSYKFYEKANIALRYNLK